MRTTNTTNHQRKRWRASNHGRLVEGFQRGAGPPWLWGLGGSRNAPPVWRSNGQTFVHGSVQVERQLSKAWLMGCSEGRANISPLIEGPTGERYPLGRWRCRRRAKSLPARDKTAIRFTGAKVGSMPLEHQQPGGDATGTRPAGPLAKIVLQYTSCIRS